MSDPRPFRCPPAARWLGRTLAASVLVSAMLLSTRIYAGVDGTVWSNSRTLVVVVGAVLALVIVRTAGRVRAGYIVTPDALRIELGRHRRELPYDQIVTVTYEPPLVSRREWLPSLVFVDRFEKSWRIPALLAEGERFLKELIRASGRDDLESFASARGLYVKMGRTRLRLWIGYGLAAALVLGCLWLSGTGPAP